MILTLTLFLCTKHQKLTEEQLPRPRHPLSYRRSLKWTRKQCVEVMVGSASLRRPATGHTAVDRDTSRVDVA